METNYLPLAEDAIIEALSGVNIYESELASQDADQLETYLNSKWDFKINEIRSKVEWKLKSEAVFKELREIDLNSLYRICRKEFPKLKRPDLQSILYSDFSPKYNPFVAYVDNLPEWEEEYDFISMLANTIQTPNQDHWLKCFKKWFVALVGCMLVDEIVNHSALVLYGGQGLGKTTWLDNLVPNELKEYKHNGFVNPKSKDTFVALSEKMFINIDELEALRANEIGAFKAMVTLPSINVRRVYGHYTEQMPRRASFAASTNDKGILTDVTGSRRFLMFETLNINYQHDVPLEGAYAQALALLRDGFKFHFDKEDIQELNVANEQFKAVNIEEDWVDELFIIADDIEEADFVGSASIVTQYIAKANNVKSNISMINRIGKILTRKGYHTFKRKNRKVYALNFVKTDDEITAASAQESLVEIIEAG
jgi:predicted P-loop ATPase